MAAEFEVSQELSLKNGMHLLDGFDFNHNASLYEHVKLEIRRNPMATVHNRYPDLRFHRQAASAQLKREALFIHRLQQPGPKCAMNG